MSWPALPKLKVVNALKVRGKFINIGSQKERWSKVKSEKGFKSDEELCRVLINRFCQFEKNGNSMSTLHRRNKKKLRSTRIFCLPDKTWKQWLNIKSSLGMSSNHEVADMLIDLWSIYTDQEKSLYNSNKTFQSDTAAKDNYDKFSSLLCSGEIDEEVAIKVEGVDGDENNEIDSYRQIKVEKLDNWHVDKDVRDTVLNNRDVGEQSSFEANHQMSKDSRKSKRGRNRGVRPNYARMALESDDNDDDEESEITFEDFVSPGKIDNSEDCVKKHTKKKLKEGIEDGDISMQEPALMKVLKNQLVHRKKKIKGKKKSDDKIDPDFVIGGEKTESCSEGNIDENSDSEEGSETDKRVNKNDPRKRKKKDNNDSSQARQAKRKKVAETKRDQTKEQVVKPWINIKLEDHQDKYKMETHVSFERKNRNCDQKEEMFSCLLCGRYKSPTRNIFEEHIELHVNKALECDKCDFVGYSEAVLLRHRHSFGHIEDNPSNPNNSREYMCEICGVILYNRETKLNHMGFKHDDPQYKCKFCEEKFITTRKRLVHSNEVHPDKVKYCKSCKKSYRSMNIEDFKQHRDSCTPNSNYQCQLCGRSFTVKPNLDDHIQYTHLNVRKHQCHLCPYAAKYVTNLKEHLMAHNNVHPFKCDQCTFTCVQRYQLTSHMRTHSGEKPFKCTKCKFAAAWNVQLKQHLPIHDLEGTILCEKCDILFKNEKSLRIHERKEH